MKKDYLDEDVAYLLGLIVGRGEIVIKNSGTIISIHFPFKAEEISGYKQFPEIIKSIHTNILRRIHNLLEVSVTIEPVESELSAYLSIHFHRNPVSLRNLRNILRNKLSYREFSVPEEIVNSENINIMREFIKGYADASGNIRESNRDQIGRHRVYLDVLNKNWWLPTQLCQLLQSKLKVPVSNILWGHPNIRDPQAKGGKEAWSREHQIRIYADRFKNIGFYVSYKNEVLKKLADENIIKFGGSPSTPCYPSKKKIRRETAKHEGENADDLPPEIRGHHFNSYWEICAKFGCEKAKRRVKLLSRQKNIFK
ncbi:MAG TPA: hypothetical protein EYP60_03955 [bacterium (Candidatus Stahlbacteria)]|nr:hypothetical protein [Candidatus Stahlbacteria bacterium]